MVLRSPWLPVNVDVISNSNALVRIWSYGSALSGVILLALLVLRRSSPRNIIYLVFCGPGVIAGVQNLLCP